MWIVAAEVNDFLSHDVDKHLAITIAEVSFAPHTEATYLPAVDRAIRVFPYHPQEIVEEAVDVLKNCSGFPDLVTVQVTELLVHPINLVLHEVSRFFGGQAIKIKTQVRFLVSQCSWGWWIHVR